MNVTITAESEEFVKRKIASGRFSSAEEVVREGLRALQQKEVLWSAEIDKGWEEARTGKLLTLEESRASLAEKKKAWKSGRGAQ
jgi:putative addiction module CopG family antidote